MGERCVEIEEQMKQREVRKGKTDVGTADNS